MTVHCFSFFVLPVLFSLYVEACSFRNLKCNMNVLWQRTYYCWIAISLIILCVNKNFILNDSVRECSLCISEPCALLVSQGQQAQAVANKLLILVAFVTVGALLFSMFNIFRVSYSLCFFQFHHILPCGPSFHFFIL